MIHKIFGRVRYRHKNARKTSFGRRGNVWPPWSFKKNMNASEASEHPPRSGVKLSKRLGVNGNIGCKDKNF